MVRERLDEGDRHRVAGRFSEAIESYLEARRLGPSVLEVYTSLGALYTGQNELEKALEAFSSGLEMMPDDRQLLYNTAVLSMRLGRLEQALGAVERALAKHRSDAELHALHGAILSRLERPDEALTALETAAKRKPGDPQILFRLGNLQHQQGRAEAAIESYRKVIKKDRSMLRAYYNLGAVLLETGQLDAALSAYEVALEPLEEAFEAGSEVDPIHARAFQNLGAIYFQKKAWQPALDAYSKALKLDSELTAALYNQGFILFTLEQLEAAEQTYLKALELDRELPFAYLHLGLIEQRKGAFAAAARWLQEGLPRLDEASRKTALYTLAQSQEALGQSTEAEASYRELLELAPEDTVSRLALGRLLRRAGSLELARQELESVSAANPESLAARMELAALAQQQGRVEEQKRLFQELLEGAGSRPDMWPVRLNLALVYLQEGALSEAKLHLDALTRRPKRQATVAPGAQELKLIATIQGLLDALEGDSRKGRGRIAEVLANDPGFAAAADIAAVLDAVTEDGANREDLVSTMSGTLARSIGRTVSAAAAANLGQVLWLEGRDADASPHLDGAAEAYPQWLSVRVALGAIALGERRYADAMAELEAAGELCASPTQWVLIGADPVANTFLTVLPGQDREALCEAAAKRLASARLGAAFEGLRPAFENGRLAAVRQLADQALVAELAEGSRSVALYVRGTAQLGQGAFEAARRDLSSALQGPLPAALRPLAHNNLGVAHLRLEDIAAARSSFEAARGSRRRDSEATLNLGILLDDHANEPRVALELYREYLQSGGPRRSEVASWVERLEKIY
ncbi:MAG: tetratricopeptide repeat protein [Acidobacteriota bacterium]